MYKYKDTLQNIKKFKEAPPKNRYSEFTHKQLGNQLSKYIRVINHNIEPKKAKGEIYRNLIRHVEKIMEIIDETEKDLLDLLDENEELFFPEAKEKITKKDSKIFLQIMGNGTKEWTKAYKNCNDEDEN
jgi:hemerythrin-like domain-containing protein